MRELSDRARHRPAAVHRAVLTRLPCTAGLCRTAVIELGLPYDLWAGQNRAVAR